MSMSMRTRVWSSRKAKDVEEKEKEESRTGGCLALTTGSLKAASMVIVVQSIIQNVEFHREGTV